MANYLDANPDIAASVETHRKLGRFVPIAVNGELGAFVNARIVGNLALPDPLDVQSYIVGMELLGYRFELGHDGSGLYTLDPSFRLPEAWTLHAISLMREFRRQTPEAVAFLVARDRRPSDEPPSA